MGWGENAWYKRLAVCLGHCSQDHGVGIWCLGLAELSRVVLGSDHSFMISCLEAKHCPTVLVTLFLFPSWFMPNDDENLFKCLYEFLGRQH